MAFEPKKIDLNAINGNSEYKKGDALQPSALNEMVKGILYAQENGGSSEITMTDDGNGNVTIANVTSFETAEGGAY